jgi:predicted kinase
MKAKLTTGYRRSHPSPQQVLRDVALLRDALECGDGETWSATQGEAILVALCGLPGTGKTHFASKLTELVSLVVLESDRLRKLLVPNPKYTPSEHSRVFNACHMLIEDYLGQGRRVLFDATNLSEAFRQPLYRICDRQSVPLILVKFTAPRDVVRRRLEARRQGLQPTTHSDADWLIYCRLSPYEEPVRRLHFTVESSRDVSPVLEDVARLVASTK